MPTLSISTSLVDRNTHSTNPKSSTEYLWKILSQYEILSMVASHLQCSDIFTLLVLSQDIHSIVLTTMGSDLLLRKSLCMEICQPNFSTVSNKSFSFQNRGSTRKIYPSLIREYCNSCGIILACRNCTYVSQNLQTSTIRHLRDCKPACDACYRNNYRHAVRANAALDLVEGALPARARSLGVCDWSDQSAHSKNIRLSHFGRITTQLASEVCNFSLDNVCGGCRWKPEIDLVSLKQHRIRNQRFPLGLKLSRSLRPSESTEPAYTATRGYWSCFTCHERFVDGNRTKMRWVCSWCEMECRAEFHSIVSAGVDSVRS